MPGEDEGLLRVDSFNIPSSFWPMPPSGQNRFQAVSLHEAGGLRTGYVYSLRFLGQNSAADSSSVFTA